MTPKLILVVFGLSLFFSCTPFDETKTRQELARSESLLKTALDRGEKEALSDALKIYKVLEEDKSLLSAYFYLNLGHMYGLQGNLGEAVAAFEKGLLIEPLNSRLSEARTQLLNGTGVQRQDSLFLKSADITFRLIPPLFIVILLVLALLSFVVWILFHKGKPVVSLILALYFLLALTYGIFRERVPLEAVVLENIELKQGDSEAYSTISLLKAGVKVKYKDERTGWSQIKTFSGEEGWVKSDSISLIVMSRFQN